MHEDHSPTVSAPAERGGNLSDRQEPTAPLSTRRALFAARRKDLWDAWQRLKADGVNRDAAARELGVGAVTLWRLEKAVAEFGDAAFESRHHLCGDKPDSMPTEEEMNCVREIYVRLNESTARGRGRGSSKVGAFRLAAKSDDPRITDEFRRVVLKRRSRTVPPSWERLLDAPASMLARVRDKRSTLGSYVTTPKGMTWVDEDGVEHPLRAGTIFESDDGTLNFPCVVPWPFGGDKCSEKFGVKVGRFQLLPVIDKRTLMCVQYDVVIRAKSSYRGEDCAALFGHTFTDAGRPKALRLERGSWESELVRCALGLSGVPVFNAWHSKQKAAVENFFDRLWTPLSLMKGDVGRQRGEHKDNSDLLIACQEGRRDPREYFPTVEEAMDRIIAAVEFSNSELVQSKNWGKWIPQELFIEQGGKELPRLHEGLKIFFSREQRVWTVRGAHVGGKVPGPLIEFPVYFQCDELWEFEGCRVKCFFDPYDDPCLGTIVLDEREWRGLKQGHVIARDVPALDLPPQIVLAADWSGAEDHQRSLAIRKAISKAVRTETWNWLGGRRSRARDGLGNTISREGGAPRAPTARHSTPAVSSPSRNSTALPAPDRVAAAETYERANALDFI